MSPRATPLSPDDRRRAIVDVVVPLLIDKGGEPSTREIAEAAGIAEGTIFRVFDDKAALWQATAEQTLDPDVELAELYGALAGCTELRTTIERAADHLLERSQRVMAVMGLVRRVRMADHDRANGSSGSHRRMPDFIVEANLALMAGLTRLFEGYRDELGVEPEIAATVLRSLALGTRHPGAHADHLLTPAEVADVMLDGVRRREGREAKDGRDGKDGKDVAPCC